MTKEENISTLNEHLDHWKRLLSEKICDQSEGEKTIDALQNAIKALEQEPCEDVVSRQAVLDLPRIKTHNVWGNVIYESVDVENVRQLPPVTPQQKIGKWIYKKEEDSYRCSLCGFPCHKDNFGAIPTKYCAGCGAVMEVWNDD